MDLFLPVNAVYSTFFGTSPPARACVCVDLPKDVRVKLECIAYTESSPLDRQALHVQGLSYWAPANIGPYSQAITVRIFVSFLFNKWEVFDLILNLGWRTCFHIRSDWSYP